MENKTYILGIGVTTTSEQKILEYVVNELDLSKSKRQKTIIFTPNPEQIAIASGSKELANLLNQAQIALPDGVGLVLAARLLGKPIYRRIAGVDFMKSLVKSVSEKPVNIGFFGGQEGVAEKASLCLQKMALQSEKIQPSNSDFRNRMRIGYASHVYDKEKMIRSDIDILFVGLGFPKQEKWIIEHKEEIPASVIMAVGGSFDFLSGRIPRAPQFVRALWIEWLFRLSLQPWRIFRQARLLHFTGLILKEALSSRLK